MEDDTPTTAGTGTRSLEEEDSTDFREAVRQKTSHKRYQEFPAEHSVALTKPRYDLKGILPPSLKLLDVEPASDEKDYPVTQEVDGGASKIDAIIKQRLMEFLVYDVDKSEDALKELEKVFPRCRHPEQQFNTCGTTQANQSAGTEVIIDSRIENVQTFVKTSTASIGSLNGALLLDNIQFSSVDDGVVDGSNAVKLAGGTKTHTV
ncbi:hypothetical protein FRC04_009027 [Tulasnella sp. 424]|nr:hypothetical protein FRC04_009027 [Tulasnella sp. 424]